MLESLSESNLILASCIFIGLNIAPHPFSVLAISNILANVTNIPS
jgi:hypothetical protein